MPEESTKMGCPKCGSTNWETLQEVESHGKNFGLFKACCGFLLAGGPLGLLCGFCGKGQQIKTNTTYLCRNCGAKFKKLVPVNQQDK